MHREPNVGLHPGTPGSRPGPNAGAKPLSHPGIPYGQFQSTNVTSNICQNPWKLTISYLKFVQACSSIHHPCPRIRSSLYPDWSKQEWSSALHELQKLFHQLLSGDSLPVHVQSHFTHVQLGIQPTTQIDTSVYPRATLLSLSLSLFSSLRFLEMQIWLVHGSYNLDSVLDL